MHIYNILEFNIAESREIMHTFLEICNSRDLQSSPHTNTHTYIYQNNYYMLNNWTHYNSVLDRLPHFS